MSELFHYVSQYRSFVGVVWISFVTCTCKTITRHRIFPFQTTATFMSKTHLTPSLLRFECLSPAEAWQFRPTLGFSSVFSWRLSYQRQIIPDVFTESSSNTQPATCAEWPESLALCLLAASVSPSCWPPAPTSGLWSRCSLHQGCPRLSWGPAFCACCLLCELSLLWPARLSSGCACEDGHGCTDPRAGRPRRKASLYRSSPAILAGLPHLLFFSTSSVKWRWDLPFNTIMLKWVFFGRTDVEAETPILLPPDAKSWLIWKDPDAGKDWGQEEKGTAEDEMVGWHHRLNGHEFG